jgi:hypothetical protein
VAIAHLRLENYKRNHEFESHLLGIQPARNFSGVDSLIEVFPENGQFSGREARTSGEAQPLVRIQILSAIKSPDFFLVELVSFSEGLDFTTTKRKLLYQMLSAFARSGRDCIRERVPCGVRNVRAKGKRFGRPLVFVDSSRIAAPRTRGNS